MDESGKGIKWKKTVTKNLVLYDFIYMNKQTYRDSYYSWPGRKTEVVIPWVAVGIHFFDSGTGLPQLLYS